MDYQKSYKLLLTGTWGGAAVSFIGIWIEMMGIGAGILIGTMGILMMIGGMVQALIFYKCPQCGRRFNFRGRRVEYCPWCGNNLNWDI